ncbi:MAG: TetR/AcrR family transcriptional regulator [Campylobacterota bacterium]|nr:TetR/AcrR family transcriptional regulator [Campylobacterota bacterium]
MAIIVDKVQKRKNIALACKDLFVQNGIKDLTISQIAQTAGIGKGSLYDYFKNKDDIVFEIVDILMQEHNIIKEKKILEATTTKEKIKVFFNFFYSHEDIELRQLYKEFVSISLVTPETAMIEHHTECFDNYYSWMENIINEGIAKNEIIPSTLKLVKGLFVLGNGIFIASSVTNSVTNVQKDIDDYIDALFEFIEVKNVS